MQIQSLQPFDSSAINAVPHGSRHGETLSLQACSTGSKPGIRVPEADCPAGGWPLVFLASLDSEAVSPSVKHILSSELVRWGLAVAWVDLKSDLSDLGSKVCEFRQIAMSSCPLNTSKFGIAFLTSDGVHLTARDVDSSAVAFMEVRVDGAPEEVAIWMMEHLWAASVNDVAPLQ